MSRNSNRIEHVIWDWNGTLVDDAWLFVDLMNCVLKKRRLPIINIADYQNTFCFPLEDYYKKLGFDFDKEPFEIAGDEFVSYYGKNFYKTNLQKGSRFVLNKDRTVSMEGDRYELSGTRMPDFIPYIEEVIGIEINPGNTLAEVENKPVSSLNINQVFVDNIKNEFEDDRYSFEDEDRLIHSHGQTTSEEVYKILYNQIKRCVDMVLSIEPESPEDIRDKGILEQRLLNSENALKYLNKYLEINPNAEDVDFILELIRSMKKNN